MRLQTTFVMNELCLLPADLAAAAVAFIAAYTVEMKIPLTLPIYEL